MPAATLEYERDIMPIFESKCYDCHSEESGKVKGGLRLDEPEHFRKRFGKNDVVVPGNWDASYLFVAITREPGAKGVMPPKGKGERLSPEEVMKVANWIYQGAKVGREKGERGSKEDDPEAIIKFRDGLMVTESFDEVVPEEEPERKVLREWVNTDGKTMKAVFGRIEGKEVVFVREDGRQFKYPIAKLSAESRAVLKELAAE